MSVSMTVPQMKRRECTVDGETVRLTPKMERVVSLLLMRRGHIVPCSDLIEYVYPDPETQPETAWNCIMVGICHADRTLKRHVRTIFGQGLIIERPRVSQ